MVLLVKEIFEFINLKDSEGGVHCSLIHSRQSTQTPDIRGHLPVDQRKLGVYLSVVMKTQFGHQQRFLLGRAHVDQIRFAAPAIVSQGLINTVLGLNV